MSSSGPSARRQARLLSSSRSPPRAHPRSRGCRSAGCGAGAKKNAESAEAGEGGEGIAGKVQTIRVNVDTLEHLMTMVSELVLTRNQLLEIARRSSEDHGYKVPLQRLSQVTAELQDGVMKTRMQPIGNAWQKLPRVVRDLSNELSKKIELVMQGADTELDRQVLEVIKDPLTHMVRNSADHGIENPGRPQGRGQTGEGHDPPQRLSRRRIDHDRDRRRRQGPELRSHPKEGRRAWHCDGFRKWSA